MFLSLVENLTLEQTGIVYAVLVYFYSLPRRKLFMDHHVVKSTYDDRRRYVKINLRFMRIIFGDTANINQDSLLIR